ncbi:hypothetical protein HPB50_002881 [Hyalomma asiaticum]|uniref:Uncharacterized protein n=1 Tax=Hyalomma asiaticum TaxID=266040 RepID=A0ACB7SEB5_HYAAI|nr:hypothetical protein HPB50_002881 [Hyalomma asiaticum]
MHPFTLRLCSAIWADRDDCLRGGAVKCTATALLGKHGVEQAGAAAVELPPQKAGTLRQWRQWPPGLFLSKGRGRDKECPLLWSCSADLVGDVSRDVTVVNVFICLAASARDSRMSRSDRSYICSDTPR